MTQTHSFRAATLLTNSKELIADGTAAELYDSVTGSFVPTGGMLAPNKFVQTVLLASGKVLVAGDIDAELYVPANGTFGQAGTYTVKAGFTRAPRCFLMVGSCWKAIIQRNLRDRCDRTLN
jgi:hypothetical protein